MKSKRDEGMKTQVFFITFWIRLKVVFFAFAFHALVLMQWGHHLHIWHIVPMRLAMNSSPPHGHMYMFACVCATQPAASYRCRESEKFTFSLSAHSSRRHASRCVSGLRRRPMACSLLTSGRLPTRRWPYHRRAGTFFPQHLALSVRFRCHYYSNRLGK